jgi:hypothetical protein
MGSACHLLGHVICFPTSVLYRLQDTLIIAHVLAVIQRP